MLPFLLYSIINHPSYGLIDITKNGKHRFHLSASNGAMFTVPYPIIFLK